MINGLSRFDLNILFTHDITWLRTENPDFEEILGKDVKERERVEVTIVDRLSDNHPEHARRLHKKPIF